MSVVRMIGISALGLLLTACAAMYVPETSDPAKKLAWAIELIEKQSRPIPAERLIVEATDIYQLQQNELGLAEAYRVYGLFLASRAVYRQRSFYAKNGFLDTTVDYATRYQKAIEYFDRALAILEKNNDVILATNVHALKAFTYEDMDDKPAACRAYDRSLASHRAIRKSQPNFAALESTKFEQDVAEFKKRLGCPA